MQGVHLRKYGVEAKVDFELYEVDGVDFRTDWTPAAGDVFMMRDEAAEEQVTNAAGNADLSTLVVDEGRGYSITLALEDMQAARIVVYLVDQATKAFLDKSLVIETYGHASAQHLNFPSDLTHIMGSILTEGGAGRLKAAFVKLFDVVTPVLLASDVMRGTDGANTTVPDAAGVAATPAEVATALSDINLDHLMKVACGVDDVVNDAALAKIVSKDATADWSDFNNTTESLEALKDGILKNIEDDTNEIQGKLPTNKFMGSSDGADDDGTLNTIDTNAARLTAARAGVLTDWINDGRLDAILDLILEDTAAQDTTTKIRTLLTGADTPVCKDSTPATTAEIKTAIEAGGSSLAQILADTGTDGVILKAAGLNADAAVEIATAVWDRVITKANHNIANSAGKKLRQAEYVLLTHDGTSQGGGANNTIVLENTASGVDNFYEEDWVLITAGTGIGQMRHIDSYVGGTFTVTVATNWTTNPDNTSDYVIIARSSIHIHTLEANAVAQVNAEVDTALADYGANTTTPPTVAQIRSEMDSNSTGLAKLGTPANIDGGGATIADNLKKLADDNAGATFDATNHSLWAIRTRGDAAWITGGGGAITDILNIERVIPNSVDLANTAAVRLGLGLTNMVDDLPSTVEISPGTITIDRKARGGTAWINIVNAAGCSEVAGLIYYDEVFDAGTGYAEGDSIRITFKNQKITVSANDFEITGTDGWMFQTYIREASGGATAAAVVTALMADTGFTAGGTMTFEKYLKIAAAWNAGNWRQKSGSTTIRELLDADDKMTVILEMVISETTPFTEITVKI